MKIDTELPFDFHDAVIDRLAVDWATDTCVLHVRLVGDAGGVAVSLTWHGVLDLHMSRKAEWGPSQSILSLRDLDSQTTHLDLQSGDSLVIRASNRVIEAKAPPATRYAELIVDALVDAELVTPPNFDRASQIAALEIQARQGMGDI